MRKPTSTRESTVRSRKAAAEDRAKTAAALAALPALDGQLPLMLAPGVRGPRSPNDMRPMSWREAGQRRPLHASHAGFVERINENAVEHGGCLVWLGAASDKGYGRINCNGKLKSPHRIVLEAKLGGYLYNDEDTRHTCDVPRCECGAPDAEQRR